MGWKTINGHSYYYSCERVRGRVVTRYRGNGDLAAMVIALDASEARERAKEREEAKAFREVERAKAAGVEKAIGGACRLVGFMVNGMMCELGYHRRKRGIWRNRRAKAMGTGIAGLNLVEDRREPGHVPLAEIDRLVAATQAGDDAARKRCHEIAMRGVQGDKGDKAALRDFANLYWADRARFRPVLEKLLNQPRDMLLAKGLGEDRTVAHVAIGYEMQSMADRLAGPNPSEIERLLADRAALCWLDAHVCDLRGIQNMGTGAEGVTLRRRDAAHRRYLSSLKALASVRKVSLVAVQVNMGAGVAR